MQDNASGEVIMRIILFIVLILLTTGASTTIASSADNASGWESIRYLDFKNAEKVFRKVYVSAAPGTTQWAEAGLGLALSLHQAQPDVKAEKLEAQRIYDEVIEKIGTKDRIYYLALYLRACLADKIDYFDDKPDPGTACKLYQEIVSDCKDEMLRNLAFLALSQLEVFSMDTARAETACTALEDWLKQFPKNPLAASQWALLGDARLYPLKDKAKAVAAYRQADAAGIPDQESKSKIYWKIANLSMDIGDRATSAEYCRKIIVGLKRSAFGYEAQQMLKKMGEEAPPLFDPFSTMNENKN